MTDSALAPRPIASTVPTGLPLVGGGPDRCAPRASSSMARSPIWAGGRWRSSASGWRWSPCRVAASARHSWSGSCSAASFYFVHIEWAAVFLGPVPWSALSTLMALWCGLGGMLITLAYRWVPRVFPTALGRLLFMPGRRRRALDPARGGRERLAVRRVLLGAGGVLAVRQPALAAVRLARRLGRRLRHGRCSSRSASRGVSGSRDVQARRCAAAALVAHVWSPCCLVVPGLADADRRHAAGRRRAGRTKAGYFDPAAALRRQPAGQIAATEPVYDQNVDVVRLARGRIGRRPARVPGSRRGLRPGVAARRTRRSWPARSRPARRRRTARGHLLQHLADWAGRQGRRRLLRQEASGAVRRIRAGSRVLAPVRAQPDRPDRARVHAGHDRRGDRLGRQEQRPSVRPASRSASTSSTTS